MLNDFSQVFYMLNISRYDRFVCCCLKFLWAANALYRNYPATSDWHGLFQLESLGEHDWHVKLWARARFESRAGSTAWAHLAGALDPSATSSPCRFDSPRSNSVFNLIIFAGSVRGHIYAFFSTLKFWKTPLERKAPLQNTLASEKFCMTNLIL